MFDNVPIIYKNTAFSSVCVCTCTCACLRTILKSCVEPPAPHLPLHLSFSSSQILPVKNAGEKARGRNGGQQNLSEEKGPLRGPSSLLQNVPRDEDERSLKKKKVSLLSKDRFLFCNWEAGCSSLGEEGRYFGTQKLI